jgi:hypothetical protein
MTFPTVNQTLLFVTVFCLFLSGIDPELPDAQALVKTIDAKLARNEVRKLHKSAVAIATFALNPCPTISSQTS